MRDLIPLDMHHCKTAKLLAGWWHPGHCISHLPLLMQFSKVTWPISINNDPKSSLHWLIVKTSLYFNWVLRMIASKSHNNVGINSPILQMM